jgi:murein DD-endopeptidase MepM/ murein hydrolase activator NlpD
VFELAMMPIWLVIGAVSLIPALRARVRPPGAVDIEPPLRGRMMTVNGGSTRATNHHLVEPSMRYAIDLVVVSSNGMRADGLAPAELDRYLAFGRDVHSVVGGHVLVAQDEFSDQLPGRLNDQPLRGNYVVVSDGENELTYAHLKHGSVRVAVGDRVERDQVIAAVGNTGNSSEPHLHLHATRGEASVPLTIGGRYLVRNDLVITEQP